MRGSHLWKTGVLLVLVLLSVSGLPMARTATGDGAPRLELLGPGTQVLDTLPDGWTHRVIRAVPHLASGMIATLPESASTSATLFRTTILADVTRGPEGYGLRAVGVGNAVPFDGRELVVTPEGPDDVRRSLTTIERVVAGRAYDELARGRLVARTPTFALLRTPTRLLVDGRHEEVHLYYALLVSPVSGALRTLNWASMPGHRQPLGHVSLLPEDTTFDCELDVAVTRKVGPWSVAWSFAMARLPDGKPLDVPPSLLRDIEPDVEGDIDSVALEKALRGLIGPTVGR